jgi:protein involved in polysaccharide export with SLBB domain
VRDSGIASIVGANLDYIPGTSGKTFRVVSFGLLLLSGCATSAPSEQAGRVFSTAPPVTASLNEVREVGQAEPGVKDVAFGEDDDQALENLWRSRTDAATNDKSSNFALGPGDVLRISLPQLDSQRDRTVRVSEEDTIAVPLLGVINISGMTEADLRDELTRRVGNYVYTPQVGVLIERTESRDVAVLGSVRNPGRYMLASHSDTIMTMISRAGGMTEEAASRIILVPAPRAIARTKARLVATSLAQGVPRDDSSPTQQTLEERVVINLTRADNQRYLELPARPSDVIIVPAAGEVTVEGWVPNPGKFKITPGMTALSAIAAAGGAQFTLSATLVREQENGGKLDLPLDLSKIKSGTERDVPLEGGDVVVAERSVVGAVPYSLYFLVSHMGIGMGLTAF